jgi:PAS domain S-box-containing protein
MSDKAEKTEKANVQKIQTSELRYRRLFEAAQDGILILNAETGMITDVNPFLINMLGYSRDEFLEKRL